MVKKSIFIILVTISLAFSYVFTRTFLNSEFLKSKLPKFLACDFTHIAACVCNAFAESRCGFKGCAVVVRAQRFVHNTNLYPYREAAATVIT